MLRIGSVARSALLLGALAGVGLLFPFAIDALRSANALPQKQSVTPDRNSSLFEFERHLVDLGRQPLAWNCQSGQPDRIRYVRDICFAEHIVEFEIVNSSNGGNIKLTALGEAGFLNADGRAVQGRQNLTSTQAVSLTSLLTARLPRIPTHIDDAQYPRYLSAIEACLSGESYLVIRNSSSEPRYEALARDLNAAAGLTLSSKAPYPCM